MFRRLLSLIVLTLLGLSILMPFANAGNDISIANDPSLMYDFELELIKSEILKRVSNGPYIDPALMNDDRPQKALLLFRDEVNLTALEDVVINARFTPSIEGLTFAFTLIKPGAAEKLRDLDGLLLALPDVYIDFPGTLDEKRRWISEGLLSGEISYSQLKDLLRDVKRSSTENVLDERFRRVLEVETDSLGSQLTPPSQDMYYVTDLLGLNKIVGGKTLKSQYNGTGVTIAVVDTGVDFGTLGLFSWTGKVARDNMGRTASFDADNQVIGFTNVVVQAYSNVTHVLINTTGSDPLVWLGLFGIPFPIPYSWLTGTTFPVDMDVTGILNPGDVAKFGVVFEWLLGLDLFPVLSVDSNLDGKYDTVYVDVSSVYKNWFGFPPEWSFANEVALTETGNTVAIYDHTGDGIPDYQAGTLAWGLDVFCAVPLTSGDTCSILEPIDDEGEYVVFLYDWHGHGTSVASVAAGVNDFVGNLYPEITFFSLQPYGSGIAPNASIIGIPIFTLFNIFEAWFWAAGFDLIPGTEGFYAIPRFGTVYGWWKYTGNHSADIISNSWGFISWEHASQGWSIYGPFIVTLFADALSLPGYLDPSYPGTLLVISAGNEGPGAGTTGPPGYSGFAITAAASTTFPWFNTLGWGGGYNDTIIYFSSRGPNVLGYPVPELSAPGAWGFAPTAIWWVWATGGDGAFLDIFGGTSMAAPVISGSAAVVIQAYKDLLGVSPAPHEVKRLLLMSAKDLGLPPNVQGAGRVDVYNAIQYLMSGVAPGNGVDVYSPFTSTNYVNREFIPFAINWILSGITGNNIFQNPFQLYSSALVWNEYPIYDWFQQGDVVYGYTAMVFSNPLAIPVTYNVEVVRDEIVYLQNITGIIDSFMGPFITSRTFVLTVVPWSGSYSFLRVQLVMDYNDVFDPDVDFFDEVNVYLYVFDWVDVDGDLYPDPNELLMIGFSPLWGTSQEVLIPKSIIDNLNGRLLVVARETFNIAGIDPIVTISLEYWDRVPHPWITPSSPTVTIGAGSFAFIQLDITVPSNAVPSVEQGYIILTPQTPGARKFVVPYSFIISMPASPLGGLVKEVPFRPYSEGYYNPNYMRGLFDFGTVDAGDHRIWFFTYTGDPQQRTFGIYAYAEWENPYTDIDMFSIDPALFVNDKSDDTWNGYSTVRQTRLTNTSEVVAVWPLPTLYTYGPETISLWNRLYDGGYGGERVTSSVRFARLNFGNGTLFDMTRINAVSTQGGLLMKVPVYIETGLDLNTVWFMNPTADPGISFWVTPSVTSAKAFAQNNSVVFNILISNSALNLVKNVGPVVFDFNVTVTADYLPYSTLFMFRLLVKPFPLPLKAYTTTGDAVLLIDLGTKMGTVSVMSLMNLMSGHVSPMKTHMVVVRSVFVNSQWAVINVMIKFDNNDGVSMWLPGKIYVFRNTGEVVVSGAFHLL